MAVTRQMSRGPRRRYSPPNENATTTPTKAACEARRRPREHRDPKGGRIEAEEDCSHGRSPGSDSSSSLPSDPLAPSHHRRRHAASRKGSLPHPRMFLRRPKLGRGYANNPAERRTRILTSQELFALEDDVESSCPPTHRSGQRAEVDRVLDACVAARPKGGEEVSHAAFEASSPPLWQPEGCVGNPIIIPSRSPSPLPPFEAVFTSSPWQPTHRASLKRRPAAHGSPARRFRHRKIGCRDRWA